VEESSLSTALRSRLDAVEERLRAACARSGRPREAVTLVAVTKMVSPEGAALLPPLGVDDLGESRPQELWRKAELSPSARWHPVGHLQRNKIERILPLVRAIHSVDSIRLLNAIDAASTLSPHRPEAGVSHAPGPPLVLLEVNASREASKQGFSPEELPSL